MRVVLMMGMLALTGCSGGGANEQTAASGVLPPGPATNASTVASDALPAELRALAERTVPGMTIGEAERKEREGRTYYDVEGTRPDGSDVELDILQESDGFRIVEIQRDIAWGAAPAAAIAAAKAAPGGFAPERVIESTQTDGTVIYELFAPGRKDEPAMEVRVKDGTAEVLEARWKH